MTTLNSILLSGVDWLGLHEKDLTWYQMGTRTLLVFFLALAFIRVSGMRTFGTSSAFDVIVAITLGGMLPRCIMGHYPFFPSLLACALLVLLHRFVAFITTRYEKVRKLTEGDAILLFDGKQLRTDMLRRYQLTRQELNTALHKRGLENLDHVASVWLEPDGTINIISKKEN